MPLNMMLPQKAIRIAQNKVTTVGANSDSPKALMFTVPINRRYTVVGLATDQSAASVDFLAMHIIGTQAVAMCDIPSTRLPKDEQVVPMFELFAAGEALTMGVRNATVAAITPQLIVYYIDEPAS
jgi:hypothetical protein